jgi:choline transporter-like protein 2/4/5
VPHYTRTVKGGSYCTSAGRAVSLIVANALCLAAVNLVGDALLFLGKLGIAAGCGVVAFGIANLEYYHDAAKYPATYLSSAILPVALAVLTGYAVAQVGVEWRWVGDSPGWWCSEVQ